MTTAVEKDTERESLVDLLKGRMNFYLMLAGFYFKPLTQEQIDTMLLLDFSTFGAGEPLLEEGFDDIRRVLRKRNSGTRQLLAIDFTSSFGGTATWKGKYAVPSASVFLSEKGLTYQNPQHEVFTIYKQSALRKKKGLDSPEDHLSFELEYLSILSGRAATAIEADELAGAVLYLTQSKRFINEQILTWFDQLADLASQLVETRFYRGVLKITKGFLLLDLQTLDDLIGEMDT
jgi:TorA maturation chaperone TorD